MTENYCCPEYLFKSDILAIEDLYIDGFKFDIFSLGFTLTEIVIHAFSG
jgi:hypothetical protein